MKREEEGVRGSYKFLQFLILLPNAQMSDVTFHLNQKIYTTADHLETELCSKIKNIAQVVFIPTLFLKFEPTNVEREVR